MRVRRCADGVARSTRLRSTISVEAHHEGGLQYRVREESVGSGTSARLGAGGRGQDSRRMELSQKMRVCVAECADELYKRQGPSDVECSHCLWCILSSDAGVFDGEEAATVRPVGAG